MRSFNHDRSEHRGLALMLTIGMHGLLIVAILLSVQWQSDPVTPVQVELWGGSAPVRQRQIEVKPEPKPVEPEETVEEPENPDIATKQAEQIASAPREQRPVAVTPAPTVKPERPAKPVDPLAGLSDQLLNAGSNQQSGRQQGSGEGNQQGAGSGAGGDALAASYLDRISSQIKRRIIYPKDLNPGLKVAYRLTFLPDGGIRSLELLQASSDPAWDKAVRDAIEASEPFPKPPAGITFRDVSGLRWEFKPQ